MIPKKIHYIWLGGAKPSKISKIIISWKSKLPGYDFIEWNEKKIHGYIDNDFVKKAFHEKKYAFVSDYVRLRILYDFGGIYLDTDMVVENDFNAFLTYDTFWGRQFSNSVGTSVIGSETGNLIIKDLIDLYNKNEVSMEESNNRMVTRFFIEKFNEFSDKNKFQILGRANLLVPTYYFYLPVFWRKKNIISYHLFLNSWTEFKNNHLKSAVMPFFPQWLISIIRNRNGKSRFRKAIHYKK